MNLGHRIRQLRNQLGLTLEQLSERSGVDIGTISALEMRGSTRSKYAQQIAAGLGVSLDELLSGRQIEVFQTPQTRDAQWLLAVWQSASEEAREVARFALSDIDAPLPAWADKDMRQYVNHMTLVAQRWLRGKQPRREAQPQWEEHPPQKVRHLA